MTEKERKPEIRFDGYFDSWEQRKLSKIGETYSGLSGKSKSDFGHGDGKFVTYMNVFSNPVTNPSLVEPIEIDDKQNRVKSGDVFFTTSSETPEEVGMSSVLLENCKNTYLNSFCFGYRPIEKLDNYYLAYMLRSPSIRKKIVFLAQGISRYNISKNKVMEIAIPIPNIDEQIRIGRFFKELENLITLHQRKCEKLVSVKKSMLEKMFPKTGSDVPELRFTGFTDPWEQRKLGEVADIYDGTHQTPQYTDHGIMFLSVENIKTLHSKKYISKDAFKKDFSVYPEKGDVLMTRIGDIGTANIIEENEPIAYYVSLALLKKKDLNPYFLKESIHSEPVKKDLWHRTLHIAFPKKINKNEIEKVLVCYPSLKDEQHKIGMFFKQLDNLITLHQRELEKLKNIKKSMLGKMFV